MRDEQPLHESPGEEEFDMLEEFEMAMAKIVVCDNLNRDTVDEFFFGHALDENVARKIAVLLNEAEHDDCVGKYYRVEKEGYKLYKFEH